MKKLLTWTITVVLFLAFAFFLGVPYLARREGMGEGSYNYARIWKNQLLACNSLEDVKQDFKCFVIEQLPDGSCRTVRVSNSVRDRPRALLKSFPDGQWIACAHASSHGEAGGGTIVTRDSSSAIHVFFGHVCGNLFARGDTLDEFYTDLRGYNEVKEVFLDETMR